MKTNYWILLLGLFLLTTPSAFSQEDNDSGGTTTDQDKYGSNPDKCKEQQSLYVEFYRQKNYTDALGSWRWCFLNCPKSSKNLYIHGTSIIEFQIKKAKDDAIKQKYVDTLMMVYNQRIQYFGQEGIVKGREGVDLFKYRENKFDEAYKLLETSVNLLGVKCEAGVLLAFMQTTVLMFKDGKITKENVVENYSKVSDAIDSQLTDKPEDETLKKVKENIESLFGTSGAPDCDVLISLYTPKFEANPTDIKLLKTITKLLDKENCTDSKLFFDASVKQYEIEPSAEAAVNLARMARKKNEFSKSAKYYQEAIDGQTNNETKAQYYLELADLNLKDLNQFSSARTYALKAIENKPGWGKPYLIIGLAYASSSKSCGTNDFEQKAVYWVAVDKFIKAKSVDPSIADEANRLIGSYSGGFPNKEEAFFYNILEGQSYTIGCWINESTTVRF